MIHKHLSVEKRKMSKSVHSHRHSHPSVLYIDDNEDHLLLVQEWLKKSRIHLELELERDGKAALKHAKTHPFDLILLDYKLSDVDGLKLLKELKQEGVNCPIIILTGQGDESIAAQAIKLGAEDYFCKEAGSLDELVHFIDKKLMH